MHIVGRIQWRGIFRGRTSRQLAEAIVSWAFGVVLLGSFIIALIYLNAIWVFLGAVALFIYLLPPLRFRDPFRVPPWELALLISLPEMLYVSRGSRTLADLGDVWRDITSLTNSFGLATLGFLIMAEIEMYTSLRTNRAFSGLFVLLFTMSVAGFSMVAVFISDLVNYPDLVTRTFSPSIGTDYDVMMFFLYTAVGGALMGVIYPLYSKYLTSKRILLFGRTKSGEHREERR